MEKIAYLFEQIKEKLEPDLDLRQLQRLCVMSDDLSFRVRSMYVEHQRRLIRSVPFLQDVDERYYRSFGQCGDQLYWKIIDYTLHIGGVGDMWDFESSFGRTVSSPWYAEDFDCVVIHDGVTSIGAWAFEDANLKTIEFPASMKEIGSAALFNAEIDVLDLPDTLEFIGPDIVAADPCRVSELVVSCDIPYIAPEAFYIRYGHFDKVTLTGAMPEDLTALVDSLLFRFIPGKVLYPRVWDTPEHSFPDLLCQALELGDEITGLCEDELEKLRKVLTPYDA